MVLAVTNHPSELDETFIESIRCLPQVFEIGSPNSKERAAILKDERAEEDIDLESIATLCEVYTGSDLLELCEKAAYFPIKDLLNEEKEGKVITYEYLCVSLIYCQQSIYKKG